MQLVRSIWKNRTGYVYLIPVFAMLLLFKYEPFAVAVVKSFYQWNGANVNKFIGWGNYIELFHDQLFYQSLKNVAILAVCGLIANLTFPLLAAVLVFHLRSKRAQHHLRVWFIIPMVVPGIVVIRIWTWVYAGDGILNHFLQAAGLGSLHHSWLGESGTAIWALVFYNFPWVGGSVVFLIYLAGLMNISAELFEAGTMDGMNVWTRFWHLELPLIRSQIKLVLMLVVIMQIQNFEFPLILTDGGPGNSTLTPALHLYKMAFTYNRMGYASAIGIVIFVLILVLTIVNFKFVKSTEKLD